MQLIFHLSTYLRRKINLSKLRQNKFFLKITLRKTSLPKFLEFPAVALTQGGQHTMMQPRETKNLDEVRVLKDRDLRLFRKSFGKDSIYHVDVPPRGGNAFPPTPVLYVGHANPL